MQNLEQLQGTPGFSGTDLANLINGSALLAQEKTKESLLCPILKSKDKVMMGAEKIHGNVGRWKEAHCVYEGGHAIVALNEKASDPIHKATIIPEEEL